MKLQTLLHKMAEGVEGGRFFLVCKDYETYLSCFPEGWEAVGGVPKDPQGNKWLYCPDDEKEAFKRIVPQQISGALFIDPENTRGCVGLVYSRLKNHRGYNGLEVIWNISKIPCVHASTYKTEPGHVRPWVYTCDLLEEEE